MSQTNHASAAARKRLYREFADYYSAERCRWAPPNPLRLFNLAFKTVYPRFRDRLTEEEFVEAMYTTLGFPGSRPRGLFRTFDPAKCHDRLPLGGHFANLFKAQLEYRVLDRLRREAKRRRRRVRREELTPGAERRLRRDGGSPYDRVEREWVDALPEALGRLAPDEFVVVRMTYWERYSLREVAVALGLDRGTVRRRHNAAIAMLRAFYGVSRKIAG
ncbi:sigma-70 family RNA polymerase sigma factor [Urbifossiella limnaea]|uniref:RNA polymerase sigma factor n=1 Tax=Urbifossiella limnaea TaxID=2528023 RepID=A0A517XSY2_9BACT|nr:sigma-70 family RNA polymerase sigma factor [Urbifossiella limnaea]QDU20597.1 RNA polymerase sigma factor [Urbifossiella limnaea]